MKNKKWFFYSISNPTIILSIILLIFLKIIVFILIKNDFLEISLGGGSDADYYHAYTIGYEDTAVNIWPVILKFFNNIGLYSRTGFSYFFLLLNLIFIPILTGKIAGLSFKRDQKSYLFLYLVCLVYPTLFFYTFDVYRDVFMISAFLLGCLFVKKSLESKSFFTFLFFYGIALLWGWFLFSLRPYLGYAFLGALFLWNIRLTKKRIIFFSISYFTALFILNYLGLFDQLTEYRGGFEDDSSGSTLSLDFSNPIMFLPNFILSFLGQLLGLYITNPIAVLLFVIETIPFIFMLRYIILNISYANKFVIFLIMFFVLYGSIWLIGNDNLGTAVRLRMFNYFSVYICFFYILSLKNKVQFKRESIK